MKRRKNRQKVETLYVLGAGSSKALTQVNTRGKPYARRTTPVDKDFLKALGHFSLNQGWQHRSFQLITKDWLGKTKVDEHGLEEAVIKRAAHYDMLSALYPDRSRKKCSNEVYLNHLSHLITHYLMQCRSNSSGDIETFIGSVFPVDEGPDEFKNRILTFNYDLVVDRPLIKRGIPKRKLYFDRMVRSRGENTSRGAEQKFLHPLLLKLHGSINWRCNRTYFDEIISGDVNPDIRIPIWSSDNCPSPEDDDSPLIIPPVPNKPITKASIFRMLWTTALEYLSEAKKIVIIGYSCPSTDVLAQAMFTQFRNMDVKDIVIVDPDSSSLAKYHDLMRGRVKKNVRWSYYHGFKEYLQGIHK